jgi:PhzF family phenazine biosynthesis protein
MTQLRLVQVDAFADRPFTGNPAAVVPLDAWLPDDILQAIAMENNLSETAFTVPTAGDADYELRWFTPTTEVALCGHATFASGHVLIQGDTIRFRTRQAGILIVSRDGAGLTLDLPQTLVAPASDVQLIDVVSRDGAGFLDIITHDGASDSAGSASGEIFLSHQGAEATAIVLLESADAVRACTPDMRALRDVDLMVIVTAPGDGGGYDIVSRVFVPAWGVDEDPVTGSAHAALAPFWCDRLGRESFTAWQASRRGGRIECRRAGDRVLLGGNCVTVIEGTLRM